MIPYFEIILRLILSAILGGLIGMEREISNRPAGLRTHILVTIGSSLIMLVSIDGFYILGKGVLSGDPARLAAQVVSGIGFIGAGTIMRTGNNITGLTTAASLWVSAGIGLAIGAGYYLGAIVTAAIVLLTLMSLGVLEKKKLMRKYKGIEVVGLNRPGLIGNIGTLFARYGISIRDIKIVSNEFQCADEEAIMRIHFLVKIPSAFNKEDFNIEIFQLPGIISVNFDNDVDNDINISDA
ncbi:MAG: MgtC/SapB family protein [Tissierellia bacterium]|nr:MgtC/SapB family protein [Tissierellia bacterium]